MKRESRGKTYQQRDRTLKKSGFKNYKDFLSSDDWGKLKRKARCDFNNSEKCCFCGLGKAIIHHMKYSFANLKKKRVRGTIPVCQTCHSEIHKIEKVFDIDPYRATIIFQIAHYPKTSKYIWTQKSKPRVETRLLSKRIIARSGLPETLHHSIHACFSSWSSLSITAFLKKYEERKTKSAMRLCLIYLIKISRW